MGNSVVKDFHKVELKQGSLSGLQQNELITPYSSVLKEATMILVRKDHGRKSTIFFDVKTMMPLYVTSEASTKQRGIESVTKDGDGRVLFFTTSSESKTKKLIYRPRQEIQCDCSTSSHSSHGHSDDLPCAAQIDIDRTGSAVCAFLSVVVWNGSGPVLRSVYKAVKIEGVKYGSLVVDMEGHVVGKSLLDEDRMRPLVMIAAGADSASVLGITSALFGNF